MRAMTAPLSRSVEDYLKAIFRLTERGAAAFTSDIAQQLGLSAAAVTGMVKRLADAGYLEHEPYRGVLLTAAGRAIALAVMRRHRILETYLTEKLRYDWASVDAEAERLEHAASSELIERMAEALGEPKYDPHGAPIPTRDGEIESPPYRSLAEVEVGVPVTLRQVGDDDPERLRYLESLGLVPAAFLVVTDRQPFGGPVTVQVGGPGGPERAIGLELAGTLRVGPASS
jgi:DtxR family Mn-dependent transcriptional regulator